MEYVKADPLPEVCRSCVEPDCDVCDYGLERWIRVEKKTVYQLTNVKSQDQMRQEPR